MNKALVQKREGCQAKVGDPDLVVLLLLNRRDQDVVELYVSVDNFLFLEKVEGEQDLFHDGPRCIFRNVVTILNHVE